MIQQINAFDTKKLKPGKGVVISEKTRTYHALILSSKRLALEVIYVDNGAAEIKTIHPQDVVDKKVTIQLVIPYKGGDGSAGDSRETQEAATEKG